VAPGLLDALTSAAHAALPRFAQGHKGVCGTGGLQTRGGDLGGGHAPAPLQGVWAVPGRVIHGPHWRLVGSRRHGLLVGHEGWRDARDAFGHRAPAARDVEPRVTEVLAQAPRGARPAGEGSAQGPEAGPRTGLRVTWPRRFARSSPSLALAWLKDAVVALQLEGRPRDALLRVGGRQGDQVARAPGTEAGRKEMDRGGAQPGGTFARVALWATPVP
jgi:hypothetical protein